MIGGFVLTTAAVGGLLLCLTLWNTVQVQRLAHLPPPSLVQLSDGQTVRVEARAHYERSPAVIRRFVADSTQALFTWRYSLPGSGGKESADPGVMLSNRARLPTSVYQAGFCLAEDLRAELLRQLAELSGRLLSGRNGQVVFTATFIGEPQPVKGQDFTWNLTVVGAQVVYAPGRLEGVSLPFNKQITVRAVDPPSVNELVKTPLEQAIQRVRAGGLEIAAIRSLTKPSALE